MSPFPGIKELPPDPLFGLKARYNADSRSDKVDLGIGAYRDNNGKPWILPAVRQAEQKLIHSPEYNHEYLSISGYEPFTNSAAKVILGADSSAIKEGKIVSQQSLSGTGALHVSGVFIKQFYSGNHTIYLSQPTWANHKQIFETIGFKVDSYPYWNNETKSLNLSGFLNTIETAPNGSIFLLHACAHNPTGLDPTKDQWNQILKALDKKQHLVIFDSAYQGFASGDLEKDAYPIRKAINDKLITSPIVICQSFAKNVGMYGERVGAIHVIATTTEANESLNKAIKSQLNKIIRSEISNPPAYGSKIVATILNDPELYSQWREDLVTMSSRISKMRNALRQKLESLGTPGTWNHITEQTGMFSFTGLTPDMVDRLEKHHGIYLVSSGRASVAGLNDHNVDKVANAFDEVVRHFGKSKL
ncbi:AAT2 Aspartate aminotransferase [Candida maltosa Xu316]|uniref:Aspartate aminotransferase n=1 Tax=Candida maltosa (strain Xu316) TaxID=1245528 RepID=M3K180_CANMX|nr:Aspartate aminotransferase [Candida maltosa Xu316]